jgi:hypothetical protein
VCDFSTTGPCERAASEIVLMDAMEPYFEYQCASMCGIPEITLEGTVDDWRSMRRRAQPLGEYELGWWVAALAPVLDRIVATAEGEVDVPFLALPLQAERPLRRPLRDRMDQRAVPVRRQRREERSRQRGRDDVDRGTRRRVRRRSERRLDSLRAVLRTLRLDDPGREVSHGAARRLCRLAQDATTLALRPAMGWAVRDAAPKHTSSSG